VRPRPLLLHCKHVIDLILLLLLLLLPLLLSLHHLHPLALSPDIVVDAKGANAFQADAVKAGAAVVVVIVAAAGRRKPILLSSDRVVFLLLLLPPVVCPSSTSFCSLLVVAVVVAAAGRRKPILPSSDRAVFLLLLFQPVFRSLFLFLSRIYDGDEDHHGRVILSLGHSHCLSKLPKLGIGIPVAGDVVRQADAVKVGAAAAVVVVVKPILGSWLAAKRRLVDPQVNAGVVDVVDDTVVVVTAKGGKPVCDDGRVDVGVHVADMFAISSIFVFDLY
jgi:hypothetical protein